MAVFPDILLLSSTFSPNISCTSESCPFSNVIVATIFPSLSSSACTTGIFALFSSSVSLSFDVPTNSILIIPYKSSYET